MVLSISLVLVLGAAVFFLLRFRALGPVAFAVVFLFGFTVAQTGAAGPINSVIHPIVNTIASLGS